MLLEKQLSYLLLGILCDIVWMADMVGVLLPAICKYVTDDIRSLQRKIRVDLLVTIAFSAMYSYSLDLPKTCDIGG